MEQSTSNEQKIKYAVSAYLDAWNTGGLEKIYPKLQTFWTSESSYVDAKYPKVTGFDEFAIFIQAIHSELPEVMFIQSSKIDFHNNSGRFSWTMKNGSEIILNGMDYFEYDDEYKITRIVGFFDYAF